MKRFRQNKILKIIFWLFFSFTITNAQQISINQIEQMPNIPSPYEMRDWKKKWEVGKRKNPISHIKIHLLTSNLPLLM